MCVIHSIYQKEKDLVVQEAIVKEVRRNGKFNSDGLGLVAYNLGDSKVYTTQTMNYESCDLLSILQDFDVVNIHLRAGTSGVKNETNCHFWKHDDFYFAHNGFVRDYKDEETKVFCDSKVFFDEIVSKNVFLSNRRIKWSKINPIVEKRKMSGRFVIADPISKKIYFYGDFNFKLLNRKVLIASSTKLTTFENSYRFMNIPFVDEIEKLEELEVELEGITCLDILKDTSYYLGKSSLDAFSWKARSYVPIKV